MYGQCKVDHKPGGRKCTTITVEYHIRCEGEGEVVVVGVVGLPIEQQVVIQP